MRLTEPPRRGTRGLTHLHGDRPAVPLLTEVSCVLWSLPLTPWVPQVGPFEGTRLSDLPVPESLVGDDPNPIPGTENVTFDCRRTVDVDCEIVRIGIRIQVVQRLPSRRSIGHFPCGFVGSPSVVGRILIA